MKLIKIAILAAFTAAMIAPAQARAPTPEERTQIETSLRGFGYTLWGDIELDGNWEIEGAKKPDSALECDLTLHAKTLQLIEEDCE